MTEDESAKVAGMIASVSTSSMFQCCAVIGAVAERGVIDLLNVAKWSEFFADNQGKDLAPEIRTSVAMQPKGFAALLRAMQAKPPGAGRADPNVAKLALRSSHSSGARSQLQRSRSAVRNLQDVQWPLVPIERTGSVRH
jgi:hypothetical protein